MNDNVLSLPLDRVLPDPEQPRKHFDAESMERLKSAIYAVGQLHPIRVRLMDEGWMIVDGQRRWLALCALAKEHPSEVRFQTIRALEGDRLDDERATRLAVQVLSNCGEDLTPIEKAQALSEIRRAEPELAVEDLAQRLGVPKGQVQFLQQLAAAPEFIQEMGSGASSEALPLWNLITLVRLHRKLRKWDDEQFRESAGTHARIAEREVKRLGARAMEEAWGKRKLQMEAERVVKRATGEREQAEDQHEDFVVNRAPTQLASLDTPEEIQPKKQDGVGPIERALAKVGELSPDDQIVVIKLLQSALERLGGTPSRRGQRRAAAE